LTTATAGGVSWPYPPPVAPPWGPSAIAGLVVIGLLVLLVLLTVRDRENGRDGIYQILAGVGTALVWLGRVFFALAEGEDRLRRGVGTAAAAAGGEVKTAYKNAIWVEKEEVGRP
jgi:hypothetical protein